MATIDSINIDDVLYTIKSSSDGGGSGGIGIANPIDVNGWSDGVLVYASTGATTVSSIFKASTYIDCSAYRQIIISIPVFTASGNTQTKAGISFYDSTKTFISGTECRKGANSAEYIIFEIPENAEYFRTTWYMDSYDNYSNWDYGFHAYYIDDNAMEVYDKILFATDSNSEKASSWGQLNAVNTALQQCRIKWTTTNSGMPSAQNSGMTKTGLPYSSASMEDGYIGISVSIYTFMCAVKNPNSVLYTEESKGYTGTDYYGTVCTTVPSSAWNLPCIVTTRAFPYFEGVTKKPNFIDLQLGDMILSSTHAKFITGIIKDEYGRIAYVKASESTLGGCIENAYISFASFKSTYSGVYQAYSFNNLAYVDNYEAIPWVQLMDESATEPVYPDLMSQFGDKVTRKYGTDINITVLDNTGYSSIAVYKDGTQIDTKSVANFTISSPAVGSYEVRMTGTGKTSSTYFDIIDNTITLNGTTLSWTNGNSTAVGGFPSYTVDANGKATSWNNPTRVHILTSAEKTAKSLDISSITVGGGFRVYATGVYGSVSWEYKTA